MSGWSLECCHPPAPHSPEIPSSDDVIDTAADKRSIEGGREVCHRSVVVLDRSSLVHGSLKSRVYRADQILSPRSRHVCAHCSRLAPHRHTTRRSDDRRRAEETSGSRISRPFGDLLDPISTAALRPWRQAAGDTSATSNSRDLESAGSNEALL